MIIPTYLTFFGFILLNHIILKLIFNNLNINYNPIYSIISFLMILILISIQKILKGKIISILFFTGIYYAYFIYFMSLGLIPGITISLIFKINLFEITLISCFILIIYSILSSNIKIKKIKIKGNTKKTKILQLSDLHITDLFTNLKINKINKVIKKTKPDIVVITGDLIDIPSPNIKSLNKIKVNCPIISIEGNHEYLVKNYKKFFDKIKNINNQKFIINNICIKGISYSKDSSILTKYKTEKNKFNILLYHKPEGFEYLKQKPNLMLCGHTHAGQIFPLMFIVKQIYKHIYGLHKINKMLLYINPGTTLIGSHLRFGTKNEATLFEIG